MKRKHILSSLLAVIMLCVLGISVVHASDDKQQTVSVIFSHDLHSHLDEWSTTEGMVGGFGRMKTCIQKQKSENPATFVVDGGDFSMGTLYQTIYESNAAELTMLGEVGVDATTFGNHEFDYRGVGLAKMLASAAENKKKMPEIIFPTLVSANINWDKNTSKENQQVKEAMDSYGCCPYTIIEREGIRVGIFGILGKDADECAPESGLEFEDSIETSKSMVQQLKKEKVDMIVCLSHSGTWEDPKESEDELLAQEVPEIDVIVSGHTHSILEDPIVYGHTYIVSSGCYGVNLGKIELTQTKENRWKMKKYELYPLNESVAVDEKIDQQLLKYKEIVNTEYLNQFGYSFDEVLVNNTIGFTPIEKFGLEHREDTLGNLISDSYIYAVKEAQGDSYEPISFATIASGVVRESFAKGPITVSDVFNVSSLGIGPDRIPGYPLVSVYLTGKELKTVAELDASIAPIMTTAQLYASGMSWTFNPHRLILNKVTEVSLNETDGREVTLVDDKLYRVVTGLYEAQMLGTVKDISYGILSLEPKDKKGNLVTDYESCIVYDKKTGHEIKEWEALASYLQSFTETGDGQVPERYAKVEGRKQVHDSKNVKELLKHPNRIFFAVIGILLVFIIVVAVLIYGVRNFIKKKRKKALE
ncbi:MAG: bifunctional UDP-sugar hydrolase/5'-nucleotidase [Lachnospiraceae bacterium]